jgi:hypothetical protein
VLDEIPNVWSCDRKFARETERLLLPAMVCIFTKPKTIELHRIGCLIII